MKKYRYLFSLVLLWAVAMPLFSQVVSNDNEDEVYKIDSRFAQNDFVPGQVLVKFKDECRVGIQRSKGKFMAADRSAVNAVLQKYGTEEVEQLLPREKAGRPLRKAKAYNGTVVAEKDLSQLYCVKLSVDHQQETMQLVDELKALDEVEFAEPNYRVYTLADETICPDYSGNPLNTNQWYLDAYGVKELWTKPIINSERPVIAILDTGVDITHPDLVDNIWTNTLEAEGEEGYDNDNNGFKSDIHGWDFINQTANIRDYNMHGTHVAGIAAAANNGIGIVGANPLAYIMPITVMQSDGTGDIATIVKGIDYAVANGATVLNLSLGMYDNSLALRQALEKAYQTSVIVAAAGNNSFSIERGCLGLSRPCFPASYSFVLGVQATTQSGGLASFSNYDCNGPNYSNTSTFRDPDGFNYELKAPGVNILSTIPNGNYKDLNGTSMAAPLVAGAISALKMVKEYDTQEILWGDLTHTDNIAQAFNLTERPAELEIIRLMLRERKDLADETEEDYSNDGRIDAGETVSIYPVIRTTWGEASNIKLRLEMGDEFEDPNSVEIITPEADFGIYLDSYSRNVSLNPLQLKVADNVANNRHIKMKMVATCDGVDTEWERDFVLVVDNVIKLGGYIKEDMSLKENESYRLSTNLAITNGATLTLEPGTSLDFNNFTINSTQGHLRIVGMPQKLITLEGGTIDSDTIVYSNLINNMGARYLKNCIIDGTYGYKGLYSLKYMEQCNLVNHSSYINQVYTSEGCYNNIVNNLFPKNNVIPLKEDGNLFLDNCWKYSNYFNNPHNPVIIFSNGSIPADIINNFPTYIGTSNKEIIEKNVNDIRSGTGFALITIDEERIIKKPYAEAHGIVWKVVVNGYDAQDEFEQLLPLGVGRHKFEVYFNRPMNKEKAPQISFGVRDPWTQNVVAEDGSWNEEGTIYTAYKTITGKTKSDGLNRIYVYGAEDNEFFEIPYEKTRFNINIQAAGSMATGFAAEAGLGKVDLTWNNENNDIEDAMGYNLYRFTLKGEGEEVVADTIRVNESIIDIEDDTYTDYNVTPGETYYYFYRTLSTDLQEYDVSNVVAVTPLTSTKGDANGSGDVDVADVITTVNYAAGQQPKPVIFEAADMNEDLSIDILDVIGIIKQIMNPNAEAKASVAAIASYTIEDGVVYVDSPVEIAGVQVQLSLSEKLKENNEKMISVAEDMKGFEHTSAWLSDNDYLFLGYNMNGKTLTAGKHAILIIGDAQIADIRLSDRNGHNIIAESTTVDKIDRMARDVMTINGIYDLQGRKISGKASDLQKLPKGVYIINGVKVVR